jgi:stress response protein YsnF
VTGVQTCALPISGRAFADEQAEVTLHREEPMVQKHTEAVERVRLEKDAVTEQKTVKGQVRKERVEVERDDERRDRR